MTQLYADATLHRIAEDLRQEDSHAFIFDQLAKLRDAYEQRIAQLTPRPAHPAGFDDFAPRLNREVE